MTRAVVPTVSEELGFVVIELVETNLALALR